MAFRASPSPLINLGNAGNAQTQTGPDLEEIQTEAIGFQALAGEAKLRLLPSPWPAGALPPPTASLLSIASRQGLVAAAGPESVVIASTESVRHAFSAPADGNIKPFTPQLTLNLGMRVSHVAFSADETFLVLSAESGGGLAVYNVQSLMQGNTQTTFEVSTNGTSLRALVPNPTAEKAELLAIVTTSGDLMIANLRTRQFLSTSQGQTLKAGVSCVSWSTKGKALMAGLGDGTCYQMKAEGEAMTELSRPPNVDGDQHVSSIAWLENDLFLVAHTPSVSGEAMAPVTTYHLITRQKQPQTAVVFQKLPEICSQVDNSRPPPYQFTQRLKDFPPNIQDVIVVASTASIDIGLVTRSKTPLSQDFPADKISNVFTTTMIGEDSWRASLPMTEELGDTSPIGIGLDLSSKDKVVRPLPKEEFDESPGPLPALMVLNNDGILASWWIVYSESIRQGTTYPGLVIAGGQQAQSQPQVEKQDSPFPSGSTQGAPAFAQNSFGKPSTPAAGFAGAFSKPQNSTFGAASTPASTFGAPSPFGSSAPHNAGSTFGKPSFGSSTPMGGASKGAAFGQASGLGSQSSPWGGSSSGTAAATGSVFGQSGFGGTNRSPFSTSAAATPFGSNAATSTAAPTSGGFASFARKPSGFMTTTPNESIFAKNTPDTPSGSAMDMGSIFGAAPKNDSEASGSQFGTGSFLLGSTFTGTGTSTTDKPKPAENATNSMFGGGFGEALVDTQKQSNTPQIKDADMEEDDHAVAEDAQATPVEQPSTTPMSKPAPPKFQFPTVPPSTGGLFGTQSQAKVTPAAVQSSQPTGFSFGKPSPMPTPITKTSKETSNKSESSILPSIQTSPKIKEEPQSDEDDISPLNETEAAPPEGYDTPETPTASKPSEAPLPPESTSKTSFVPGDSSNSSKSSSDDAPLPPDFLPSKTKLKTVETPPEEEAALTSGEAPLPPDFLPSKNRLKPVETPPEEEATLPSDDEHEGSEEGSEEASDEDDGDLSEEGSGIDVAQEISPSSDANQSPKFTPGSSFGGPLEKTSPGDLFSRITRPQDGPNAKSLFGEVGKTSAPFLPPPNKDQGSPRSPSPVRRNPFGSSLRPDNARSISAPHPLKALTDRKNALSKMVVSSKPQPSVEQIRRQEVERFNVQRVNKAAEEEQDLSDREDERVREELATEVEASKILEPFLAHQDYIGNTDRPGIPGQIEKVYRDINSMIDTLGINARSLKAFVKGQETMHKDGGRSREDLETDDWCLIEIGDLEDIEHDLGRQLKTVRPENAREILDECSTLRKSMTSLQAKRNETHQAIAKRSDEQHTNSARSASLSFEQATQQRELRKRMLDFQKLLSESEEKISMLQVKLASCETGNGKNPPLRKPTVEAVTNTVRKMTSIIEKKNADIDVLENQLRNLRFSSPSNNNIADRSSREGSLPLPSPFPRSKQTSKLSSSTLQNGHTPNHSLSRSNIISKPAFQENGTPKKKTVQDVTEEDVRRYQEKTRRRQEVNNVMKEAFSKAGPRISVL